MSEGAEPLPIAAVVLAKNEAVGIADCVSKLTAFADVVVVDSHSTDGTPEIAEAAGARVVQFAWNGQYPKKKQWSLENTSLQHDWVLLLDADESPSPELLDELRALVPHLAAGDVGAFDIALQYRFAGKFLKHGHRVVKRSLLNRQVTAFPEVGDLDAPGIREVEGHYQPETDLRVAGLKGRIVHDDRDPVESWFERHNRYSSWEAHLRSDPEARRAVAAMRSSKGQVFDRVPFKPLAFFTYSYIARAGFLDGRAGFDYAVALASYYWQIGVKYRELERDRNEA